MVVAVLIRLFVKESPVIENRKKEAKPQPVPKADVVSTAFKQKKGKSFIVAMGLRFAQGGNSGLLKTFMAGFVAQTVLHDESGAAEMMTTTIMFASIVAFITIPLTGVLGDKLGRRRMYLVLNSAVIVLAIPVVFMISTGAYLMIIFSYIIIENLAVEGTFALENVTLAELFGSKNRLTLTALAKEIAGLIATGFGPTIAALLVAIWGWVPLAIMMMLFSGVAVASALWMPEVAGRDLNDENDAF
jgi:MHS family metabolite:H+ symporter-like MFS transporter